MKQWVKDAVECLTENRFRSFVLPDGKVHVVGVCDMTSGFTRGSMIKVANNRSKYTADVVLYNNDGIHFPSFKFYISKFHDGFFPYAADICDGIGEHFFGKPNLFTTDIYPVMNTIETLELYPPVSIIQPDHTINIWDCI